MQEKSVVDFFPCLKFGLAHVLVSTCILARATIRVVVMVRFVIVRNRVGVGLFLAGSTHQARLDFRRSHFFSF